jgi:hypothetical protein
MPHLNKPAYNKQQCDTLLTHPFFRRPVPYIIMQRERVRSAMGGFNLNNEADECLVLATLISKSPASTETSLLQKLLDT